MIKFPSRILRMPKRRQKIAAKKWLITHIQTSLNEFVGRPNSFEVLDEITAKINSVFAIPRHIFKCTEVSPGVISVELMEES